MAFFGKKEQKSYFITDKNFSTSEQYYIDDNFSGDALKIPLKENNIAYETMQIAIERADFPIRTYLKTNYQQVYISKKNEKNLFDLIEQIEAEIAERKTVVVHEEKTEERNFNSPAGQNYRSLNSNFQFKKEEDWNENDDVALENLSEFFSDPEKEKEIKSNVKPRKKLGRTVQKSARFTPDEWEKIEKEIEKSGLSQGEYFRKILLEGKVKIIQREAINEEALQAIKKTSADVGRIGGLLKNIIKSIKENGMVSPVDNAKIESTIREIEQVKHEWIDTVKRI